MSLWLRRAILAAYLLGTAAAAEKGSLSEQLRGLLDAGKLDEIVLALQDHPVPKSENLAVASVLAEAALRSHEAHDPILTLQFSQMALRLDGAQPVALELAARRMLEDSEFGSAERYTDRWIEVSHGSPSAQLLRAEIARGQGEWDKALAIADPINADTLQTPVERDRLQSLRLEARKEAGARKEGVSTLRAFEAQVAKARSRRNRRGSRFIADARPAAGVRGVIVYGTSWCGFCKQAKAWLARHGVAFEDRDVEKDVEAAREIGEKAARAGVRISGVPVIDFDGQIVRGFDEGRLKALLAARG